MRKILASAAAMLCFSSLATADTIKAFEEQNGIRIYRGLGFTDTKFEPATLLQASQADQTTSRTQKPDGGGDPEEVEIPDQGPIARTEFRIRCSTNSSSCPLSQVVVDILDQPTRKRVKSLPAYKVRIGTEVRDGKKFATADVFRRGVIVHRAGLRDDLRIVTHPAGEFGGQNIAVHPAGEFGGQNIRVHRAGVFGGRNIRVHRWAL